MRCNGARLMRDENKFLLCYFVTNDDETFLQKTKVQSKSNIVASTGKALKFNLIN